MKKMYMYIIHFVDVKSNDESSSSNYPDVDLSPIRKILRAAADSDDDEDFDDSDDLSIQNPKLNPNHISGSAVLSPLTNALSRR